MSADHVFRGHSGLGKESLTQTTALVLQRQPARGRRNGGSAFVLRTPTRVPDGLPIAKSPEAPILLGALGTLVVLLVVELIASAPLWKSGQRSHIEDSDQTGPTVRVARQYCCALFGLSP